MNKAVYIIGGIVVLLIAGWFLTRGSASVSGVDVDNNLDGSKTYSNEEGSVTVGGGSMPDNWPGDAPANFAGATIAYSGTSNPQTGAAGPAASYPRRASAPGGAGHYQQN